MTSTWIGPMAAMAVRWVCGVTQAQAFSITHTLASGTNAFAMTTLLNTQIPVQNPVKSTSPDGPDGHRSYGTDPGGCDLENISYLHSCESKRERG